MSDQVEVRKSGPDHSDANDLFVFLMSDSAKDGLLFEVLQNASVAMERKRLRNSVADNADCPVSSERTLLEPSYYVAKKLYLERKGCPISSTFKSLETETRH